MSSSRCPASLDAAPTRPVTAQAAPAKGPAAARTSALRRQMEARLRLRRRLLRIHADDSFAHGDSYSTDDGGDRREPTMPEKGKTVRVSAATRGVGDKKSARVQHSEVRARISANDDDGDDDDDRSGQDDEGEDGDAGDGEDGNEEEEEEEEEDQNGGGDEASGSTETLAGSKPKGDKCDLSPVIKLLFSRSDPRGRAPTVWFDYPPHLNVTRKPPPPSTGVSRLVSVNAANCELFFKTHWERNCVKNAFAAAGLRRTKKRWSGWHAAWAKHMPRDKFKMLRENQAFSHFPDPWVIGRKDRLMKTLTTYKRRFGASYAFFPEGFTLPDHLAAFKRATSSAPTSLWILKPPAAACGRGIRVVSARDVDSFLTNKDNKERKYVAQKYLANPLLVDGFKFDLRIYVLVTSVDPLRIYLFEEGLTRFCTTPYSLTNTKNRFAHLTNYSVNKNNKHFVENASAKSDNTGNKWSMTALLERLHAHGVVKDVAALRAKIKDVICKTVIAAEAHLTPLMHQYVKGFRPQNIKCYELFGFDMMLDEHCTPWLIEANVSPSLMAASPLDKRVKGLLLSDIFHLVGVPVSKEKIPMGTVPEAFQKGVDADENNGTAPPSARAATINRQLHELVLDAKVPVFEKKHLDLFSPSDWTIIHDMEDEMERLGHFERIYPCASAQETAKYAPFFTCPRYSNALCAKWVETKNRSRQKASAVSSSAARASAPATAARLGSRSNSFGGPTPSKAMPRGNSPGVSMPAPSRLVVQAASR